MSKKSRGEDRNFGLPIITELSDDDLKMSFEIFSLINTVTDACQKKDAGITAIVLAVLLEHIMREAVPDSLDRMNAYKVWGRAASTEYMDPPEKDYERLNRMADETIARLRDITRRGR